MFRILDVAIKVVRSVLAPLLLVALFIVLLGVYAGDIPGAAPIAVMIAYCIWASVSDFDSTMLASAAAVAVFCDVTLDLVLRNALVPYSPDGIPHSAEIMFVVTVASFLALLYFLIPYEQGIWERQSMSERFGRIPYRFANPDTRMHVAWQERDCGQVMHEMGECSYDGCRDILRDVASSHDDDVDEGLRLKALGRLRLPDDDDVLRRELPLLDDYAGYDLSKGWPHTHSFEKELLSTEEAEGNPGDYECVDETYRLRCSCGLTKREVRRIHKFHKVEESHCPVCGGTSTTYDYYAGEVCSGCGHGADDFTEGTVTDEVSTEILATDIDGWE